MKEKIEIPLETFVGIQKFIGFIDGFIVDNNKIDSKAQEKIKEKIEILDEILEDLII